jgi:hypothetical protein
MPVSPDEFFMLYFNANLFEEIAAETNSYISKKNKKLYNMNLHSANLTTLSHLEFCKKVFEVLVGNILNKLTQMSRRLSSTDVED